MRNRISKNSLAGVFLVCACGGIQAQMSRGISPIRIAVPLAAPAGTARVDLALSLPGIAAAAALAPVPALIPASAADVPSLAALAAAADGAEAADQPASGREKAAAGAEASAAPAFSRRAPDWRRRWARLLEERFSEWSRLPGFSSNWYHQTEGPSPLEVKVLRLDRSGNAVFLNGQRSGTYKLIDLRVVGEAADPRFLAVIRNRNGLQYLDARASSLKGSVQFTRGSWPALGVTQALRMRRWQEAAGLYEVPAEHRAQIAHRVAGTPFDTLRDAALRAAPPAVEIAADRRPQWRRDWKGFLREHLGAWERMPEFSRNWYRETEGPYPLHLTVLSRDRNGAPVFLNGMSPRSYRVIDLKLKKDSKGVRLLAVVRDGRGSLRFLETRPEHLNGAISFSRGSWPSLSVGDAYRMLEWQKKAGLYEVPKRYRDAIDSHAF
ncbi:MAG: hypothetical protein ACHQ2Z_02760 [Elusimicrobiota bacterium]